jgi:surface antigen
MMFGDSRLLRTITFCLLLTAAILSVAQKSEASWPMPGCQCTDFVYSQRPDLPTTMGRAKDFLYSARIHRFPYNQVPQVGDVAVCLRGAHGFSLAYGHVAYVIAVNEDRDRISIAGWNGLVADCKLQIHLDLSVTANTYFIHHKEPVNTQTPSLEEWIALEGEGKSKVFEYLALCNPGLDETGLDGSECQGGLKCCPSTEPVSDNAQFELEENSISRYVPRPNFFLE